MEIVTEEKRKKIATLTHTHTLWQRMETLQQGGIAHERNKITANIDCFLNFENERKIGILVMQIVGTTKRFERNGLHMLR